MSKYINANSLKLEVEKYIKEVKDAGRRFTPNMGFFDAKLSGINDVMAIIDSLQQEQLEVDLDVRRQIEELANDWHHKGFASDEDCPLCMQDLMDILWYFYELGRSCAI